MLQTYEAVFKDGQVCFTTPPKHVKKPARLLVVFLDRPMRRTSRPRTTVDSVVAKMQKKFAVPGRSLADELIAERRCEAAHE